MKAGRAALPQLTSAEVVRRLAREVELIGNKSLAARSWKISPQLLSFVLNGKRRVGPKLLKALKLQRIRIIVDRYEAL